MAGMVNFRKPGGKGGGSHSTFITFRTMHQDSKGWVVPAKPGKQPAKITADELRPVAVKAFTKAVELDQAKLLGG